MSSRRIVCIDTLVDCHMEMNNFLFVDSCDILGRVRDSLNTSPVLLCCICYNTRGPSDESGRCPFQSRIIQRGNRRLGPIQFRLDRRVFLHLRVSLRRSVFRHFRLCLPLPLRLIFSLLQCDSVNQLEVT